MAATLTAKEQEMLTVVIELMNDLPQVDFNLVAEKTGHKYSKNARAAFKKAWDKLKAGNGGKAIGTGMNNDSGEEEATPKKTKATPTKGIAKQATPRKAADGGPKKPRKNKKVEVKEDPKEEDLSSDDIQTEQDGKSTPLSIGSRNWVNMDVEEQEAVLLSIPVEEYRKLSFETLDESI